MTDFLQKLMDDEIPKLPEAEKSFRSEEWECAMAYLDDLKVPRANPEGIVYSIVGRICFYGKMASEDGPRIGKNNICPINQQLCEDECCPPGAVCNISGNDITN